VIELAVFRAISLQTLRFDRPVLIAPIRGVTWEDAMKIADRNFASRLFLVTSASLVALAALGTSGKCQELAPEGQFKITYTAVNTSPTKPIAISKTKDIWMNNFIMTASNDAGNGLLHGLAGRCALMVIVDKTAKTVEYKGSCNYTDRSGDVIFEDVATTAPQPLGPVIAFKGSWTGGTGKYAGLTGDIDIRNEGVLATESLTQSIGKKTGTYKIVP
jgi:hypothetical protein